MRFSKKTAHRIIISLAMVFPIAYMLGTLIATLAGSHGEINLSQTEEIVLNTREVDFNQLVSSHDESLSYENLQLDCVEGYWHLETSAQNSRTWNSTLRRFSYVNGHKYVISVSASGTPMASNVWQVLANNLNGGTVYKIDSYYTFTATSSGISNLIIYVYPTATLIASDFVLQVFDITQMYGSNAFDTDLLRDYDISQFYPYTNSVIQYFDEYGIPSYSQYLFSQMFPSGNFVERIGKNAVSVNPKGFAPFGDMLRYMDLNMLHAGDTQIGLMFYGMIYWMLHVILADLVYHMLVFIPNLIMRVSEWFGHGLDDDKGE